MVNRESVSLVNLTVPLVAGIPKRLEPPLLTALMDLLLISSGMESVAGSIECKNVRRGHTGNTMSVSNLRWRFADDVGSIYVKRKLVSDIDRAGCKPV